MKGVQGGFTSTPATKACRKREGYSSPYDRRVWLVDSIGIIMNGVTGRMGTNQHLERSIVAIRRQGGIQLRDGRRVLPDPVLLGRNAQRLEALARKYEIQRWSTSLE